MDITIALAQIALTTGSPAANEATARRLAADAATRGAGLLILPELWHTGYDMERAADYAAALDHGPFGLMADLAREHRSYVVGTALEANPTGAPFNTAALYGPDGRRVGAYRKMHLYPPLGETVHMTPGEDLLSWVGFWIG